MSLAKRNEMSFGSLGNIVPAFGDIDPFGVFKTFSANYKQPGVLRQGFVVAYHPQTHSASVRVLGEQSDWSCIFADEALSYSFGFSTTSPSREGEFVLVYETEPQSQAGIIIGRIPYPLCFAGKGDLYNDPLQYHRRSFTFLKNTWDKYIPCFSMPFGDPNDDATHISTHLRPTDVYPGEFAHLNQHNCGLKGGLFSATLLGGGASLRLSALTNNARLSCANYARHSLLGTMSEFNNGRWLSYERNVAFKQNERLKSGGWTDDNMGPQGGENVEQMKPRIKELGGFFGNLIARYCLHQDTDGPKGVSRETIDPSGQYRLSAAGMIAIERTGRIPVPMRVADPKDPGHDFHDPCSGHEEPLKPIEPFEHKLEDPNNRQLELYDRQAYDLKTQYSRVDYSRATCIGTVRDYTVKQEEELQPLEDDFGAGITVGLKQYDKRRAGIYIGEDGSVILRDAWGSEVVMLGGNVTIACAGNVMLLPGKSQLTVAGDDIVQKAQNSVDIHASEHDIRLSAARNMEIRGGGDENQYSGGVIIESRGKAPAAWDGKDLGEGARLSGITLKASKQAVVVDGQRVLLRSREDTRLLSGKNDKLDGRISLSARTIRTRAKSTYLSSGDADFVLAGKQANVVARTINILADSGLGITRGSKAPVLKWEDIGENNAANVLPQYDDATKDLDDESKASAGFDVEALTRMIFGFRTSQECRTDRSWTIGDSGGKFRLYEPAWIQVMKVYETLRNGGVDTKVYEEKPGWDNGRPFPGKEAETDGEYRQLTDLKPKNITDEGLNVSRKDVKASSGIKSVPLKNGYRIRK